MNYKVLRDWPQFLYHYRAGFQLQCQGIHSLLQTHHLKKNIKIIPKKNIIQDLWTGERRTPRERIELETTKVIIISAKSGLLYYKIQFHILNNHAINNYDIKE